MASGVNVKMGVSGVAQFKQSINQAKTSIKTLDAQLALTEKQYKATGDAETYMQQKTEQLQGKLEAQKQVVENAEKALQDMTKRGVETSSKAYQDMLQTLTRAKTDLLDTEMQMQGVEAASDDAAAGISDMNDQLSNIGSQISFKTVTDGIDGITDKLKNAAKRAWDLGTALIKSTLGAGEWADEILEAAQKAGMDPETYQQAVKTANLIDTSVDSIIASKQKLAQATEKDNEEMEGYFARLGVQTKRYGEVRDLNDVFWETGEALMKIQNEADRDVMGKKIFGNWRELIPLFTTGREEYEKLRNSQSYVDKEHLDSLGKMDDQYKQLTGAMETLKMEVLSGFAEPLEKGMKILTDLFEELNTYLKTPEGQEMLDSMGKAVEGLFKDLSQIDPQQVVEGFTGVFNKVIEGFQWLEKNSGTVIGALEAIVGGWALIELTGGALKVMEFVNGIRGLTGTSVAAQAAAAGTSAGSSWAASFASAATTVLGAAGLAGIVFGFKEAAEKRNNTPELVRGTEENFAKEASETSDDVQGAFIKYVEAQKAVQDLLSSPEYSDEKMSELMDAVNTAQEALMALEGSDKILKAYSDWRQEHSLGNDDWILPDGQFLEESATTIGENTAIGLANGIDAKADEAIGAAEDLAEKVEAALAGALEVKSPSRVMMRIGEYVSAGFAEGIENGYDKVNEAVDNMARVASSVAGGRGSGGVTSSKMIDVTLMIGPDKLTEVVVPLVDSSLGAEIDLMRR